MKNPWAYGTGALALVLACAGLAMFFNDSGEDLDSQIVDLTIPPNAHTDEGIRRIPLDPALPEVSDDKSALDSPVGSDDPDRPVLPGSKLEGQEPELERLPAGLLAANSRRGRIVDEGVRFGEHWVLIGELFTPHAWVEIVDQRGTVIWQQNAKDHMRAYWQVLSNTLDLTLDGKPDLHMISYTGGLHCCTDHLVFESNRLRAPHTLYQGDGDAQQFRKLDDGAPVIWIPDGAAYLWTSFAGSAVFWMPIRFDGREFSPALQLMSRPVEVTRDEVRQSMQVMFEAYKTRELVPTDPLAVLLQAVGDEIYAGRTKSAQTLISDVWPEGLPGETDFRCAAVDWFEIAGRTEVLEALNGMPVKQILQRPARCPSEEDNRWAE